MIDPQVVLDAVCSKMTENDIPYKAEMSVLCIDRYGQQQILFVDDSALYEWFITAGKELLDTPKAKETTITTTTALFFMAIATEDLGNKLEDLLLWYSVLRELYTKENGLSGSPTVFWMKIDTPPVTFGVIDEDLWKARFN